MTVAIATVIRKPLGPFTSLFEDLTRPCVPSTRVSEKFASEDVRSCNEKKLARENTSHVTRSLSDINPIYLDDSYLLNI